MKSRKNSQGPPEPTRRSANWALWLALFFSPVLLGYVVFRGPTPQRSESPAPPTMTVAVGLLSEARFDDAEWALRQILSRSPDATSARDELRWVFFNQLRGREVEAILEDAVQRSPGDLRWAIDLLMSEFRPQNPRESVLYWERMEALRPGQGNTAAALGYCYWKLGRHDDARRQFQTALDRRPGDFRIQLLAAEFLLDSGDAPLATPLLEAIQTQAGTVRSGDARPIWLVPERLFADRVWYLQSLRAESSGEWELALGHLDQAISLRPLEVAYLHRRGQLERRLGREESGAASLSEANRIEKILGQLTEIVLGGELDELTVERCRRIAACCAERGKPIQAAAWKQASESGGVAP